MIHQYLNRITSINYMKSVDGIILEHLWLAGLAVDLVKRWLEVGDEEQGRKEEVEEEEEEREATTIYYYATYCCTQ